MAQINTSSLDSHQIKRLLSFSENVSRLGADFAVFDSSGKLVLTGQSGEFNTDRKTLYFLCLESLKKRTKDGFNQVCRFGESLICINLLDENSGRQLFAFINLPQNAAPVSHQINSGHLPRHQLLAILGDYLQLLADGFKSRQKSDKQVNVFTRELSQVYEELVLIHKLSSGMAISDSEQIFLRMACRGLSDIVNVENISILLIGESNSTIASAASSGTAVLDQTWENKLFQRLITELEEDKEALVDSAAYSEFKYDWPQNVRSIIAVPLYAKERSSSSVAEKRQADLIGLLYAVNRIEKPDFDTADIKLFNSVATNCAVFVENNRLFKDLKELFIGSLKALTSSIDAKDKYTRGHSERVAAIAKWIAQQYSKHELLDEDQIHNIYLAGLLHDIGKIGIAEAVLCKKGKLTEEEMDCIKKHPSIGAEILSGIKQMKDLIPSVLYHHERIDGSGYPQGLKGDSIPLAAKIIAIADSLDAMTSARIYRPAMPVETAVEEIRKNLGTQYDRRIGQIFLQGNLNDLWLSLCEQNSLCSGRPVLLEPQQSLEEMVSR